MQMLGMLPQMGVPPHTVRMSGPRTELHLGIWAPSTRSAMALRPILL